jgi:hypothetical protein
MGRVWGARDEVLHRDVAVKEVLLPPAVPQAEREALVARTLREGRAAARVRSPRVVTVYDVVEDDDRPWLVMQALEPRTLADVLAAEGPLDPARAALIGLQVLDGLAAVHGAGVLHRDVKPANVLFGPDCGAVLADFGVATLEDDAAVTSTGLVIGSPAYLAPERARGEAPTRAADLWSLGATLFAAVEGRSPFHREGPLPTLGALLTEDVPAAPAAGPLAPAIAALLTKDPAARPDAETTRSLLRAALTLTPRPAPADEPSAPVPAGADGTVAMWVPDALEVARPTAAQEAWEVPARALPRPSRVTPATAVPAGRDGGPATVVTAPAASVPFPRRRALVALAVVALLSGPVAALTQRPGASLTASPAAAGGTALLSTTPEVAARTSAAPPQTTDPKAGSAPADERTPAQAAAPRTAAGSATVAHETVLARSAASRAGQRDDAQVGDAGSEGWIEDRGDKNKDKDQKDEEKEKKDEGGKGQKGGKDGDGD